MTQNLVMDISRTIKDLIINDPFYGLFLSTIEKKENKNIPLAAVGLNKSTMEFSLHINPDEWFKISKEVKYGVMLHEASHLTDFHLLTADKYPNDKMDNVATDCSINQRIDKKYLPSWGVFIEDLEKKYPELNWRRHAGRDHYYRELSKLSEEQQEELGISDKCEHHWFIVDANGKPVTNLTDSEKSAVQNAIEHTIATLAEEVIKMRGSLPAEIDQLIKGFVKPKPKFDYKKYIRNFVGASTKYFIKSSRVKENPRFPGQPKVVLRPMNQILVLIDESGSVSETELFDFLNEIYHMSKYVNIEIRPFDTQVGNIVKYTGKDSFPRTNCGGTSFTAAVDFYNNYKKYNTCIIFTDGHAEVPPPCYKDLLWVISSNGTNKSIKSHAKNIKIPIS